MFYTLYGYLAIYCIICYFVYIVNIESDAIKPVSDYFCCNSCIETDDWLNFNQSGSNDEQASIMLKIPIITKLIYRGESMWMGQCSALAMRVECLQFVLFLNIGVGGGDNSVQQFIGLLELF